MTAGFEIRALSGEHDRRGFASGSEPLDRYFREFATQDVMRRLSNCFVAVADTGVIAGYYTFAATGVPLSELPAEEARRLPRYPLVPAGLIGRLAVDLAYKGRGLGAALVMNAAARAARADPAIFAIIVEAKDDSAVAFYEHLQFRRFASRPMTLFLPLATALAAMGEK